MKKNNQVPDWNRDKSWDKIEQRLDEKKKRRPLLWWLFGGSAVAILVAGIFIFGLENIELEDQLISESVNQLDVEIENQLINESVDSLSKMKTSENELSNFNKNKPENSINKTKKQNQINENINQVEIKVIPRLSQEDINNGFSLANYQKRMVALAGISIPINTDLLPNAKKIEKTSIFFDTKTTNKIQNLSSRKSELNIEKTPILPQVPQLQIENSKTKKRNPKLDLIWFAESGLSTGRRIFHGDRDYTNRRSQTETYRFTSTSNFGIEKDFSDLFYWRAGINFQTFFEKYDATATSTEIENVFRDSVTYYILNDGQRYYEPGTTQQTTTYSRRLVKNNFLYRLSLPISFGLKFNLKKSAIAIDAGVKPTIYQHFSGTVLDENDLHLFDNQVINERYYSNDFDLGLISNISIRYPISNSTQIGLGLRSEIDDAFRIRKEDPRSRYIIGGGYLGVYRRF